MCGSWSAVFGATPRFIRLQEQTKDAARLDSPRYLREPPISCSYEPVQPSCALSSILLGSRTGSWRAPLVPRSLNPSVTSGQCGSWLIVDSCESKTAHRVVKTGQSDGCATTNAYRLRSGGGFFRSSAALLFRCVLPKKGEEIS